MKRTLSARRSGCRRKLTLLVGAALPERTPTKGAARAKALLCEFYAIWGDGDREWLTIDFDLPTDFLLKFCGHDDLTPTALVGSYAGTSHSVALLAPLTL